MSAANMALELQRILTANHILPTKLIRDSFA